MIQLCPSVVHLWFLPEKPLCLCASVVKYEQMNREALSELFDFTTFTWQTYAKALRDLPRDSITTPVPNSGWPALRNTLFHIATA